MTKVWYKNYPPTVRKSLEYPEKTLMELIIENSVEFGDRIAIKSIDNTTITYKQLVNKINKLSNALMDLGIKKGDRIALMIPNSPEYIISFLATLNIGATAVPINPLYKGRDISYRLNDSGTKILIIDNNLIDRYVQIRKETNLNHVIAVEIFNSKESKSTIQKINSDVTFLSYDSLLKTYSSNLIEYELCTINENALLCYTGGTTGISKGAVLTHKNIIVNIFQAFEWLVGLENGKEIIPLIMPASHISALNMTMNLSLATAQTLIVKQEFTVNDILEMIEEERVTVLGLVPTLFVSLINHPKLSRYDLTSLKIVLSGAAATPLEVQKQFERITGCKITDGYGLTECSPGVCVTPVGGVRREKSIGVPLPDTNCKIVDLETGTKEVPIGEVGELIVQGPQVMKGYWNKPEENKIALRNGWLYTGDIAYRDEDGFFYIADRKKDVIVTGGYNVYPREVEEILYEMKGIRECAVIGVPHEYYGETVKAVVTLKDEQLITEQEIINFCKQHLTTYKCPTVVEVRDELPKSPVGKILRRELKVKENKLKR